LSAADVLRAAVVAVFFFRANSYTDGSDELTAPKKFVAEERGNLANHVSSCSTVVTA
jgi:hypothetical protein